MDQEQQRAERRARSLANLVQFTSENQPPGHKKSRKGIPNRATIVKLYFKEADKRQRRQERAVAKAAARVTGSDEKVTVAPERTKEKRGVVWAESPLTEWDPSRTR